MSSLRRGTGFAVLVLLAAAAGVLPRLLGQANPDVVWLSHLADRMLEGMDLYTEVLETNPPLAVWAAVPASVLSGVLPIETSRVFHLLVLAACLGSIAAVGAELRRADVRPSDRWDFLGVVAVVVLLVPGLAFGQREHLAVVLSLPYLVSVVLGADGADRDGLVPGLAAGAGFAFKPHFLLVPVAAEGWARLVRGDAHRVVRPATVGLAAVVGGYALAVLLWEPDYLVVLRDLVIPFYPHYNPRPWFEGLASGPAVVAYVGMVAGLLRLRSRGWERGGPVSGFVVLTAAWLVVAVVQGQRMSYHYLPAVGCSILTIGAALALPPASPGDRRTVGGSDPWAGLPVRTAVLGVLAVLVAGIGHLHAGALREVLGRGPTEYERLRAVVEAHADDTPTLAALNLSFADVYALVEDTDARWALRHAGVWPVVAARRRAASGRGPAAGSGEGEAAPLAPRSRRERAFRDEIVRDLRRSDPDVVLVPHALSRGRTDGLDVLRYFCRDEAFRRWFRGYRLAALAAGQEVYVRGRLEAPRE